MQSLLISRILNGKQRFPSVCDPSHFTSELNVSKSYCGETRMNAGDFWAKCIPSFTRPIQVYDVWGHFSELICHPNKIEIDWKYDVAFVCFTICLSCRVSSIVRELGRDRKYMKICATNMNWIQEENVLRDIGKQSLAALESNALTILTISLRFATKKKLFIAYLFCVQNNSHTNFSIVNGWIQFENYCFKSHSHNES